MRDPDRQPGQPEQTVNEARPIAEGARTRLVWEVRGMPVNLLPAYGAGIQIHVEHPADYIIGRELCNVEARWNQLFPAYKAGRRPARVTQTLSAGTRLTSCDISESGPHRRRVPTCENRVRARGTARGLRIGAHARDRGLVRRQRARRRVVVLRAAGREVRLRERVRRSPIEFEQLGINLTVLEPGQIGLYHAESNQEAFLVLSM